MLTHLLYVQLASARYSLLRDLDHQYEVKQRRTGSLYGLQVHVAAGDGP
jgi:hypothetical protein